MRINEILSTVFSFAIDIISPADPETKEIERLGAQGFALKAKLSPPDDTEKYRFCLYSYKDPLVKRSVLEVKSHGNRKIAAILARNLYDALIAELCEKSVFDNFTDPLLVPMPMTRRAIRIRGWNQCELLVHEIDSIDRERVFEVRLNALEKIRETEDQVGKNRPERFKNLNGSLLANTKLVLGRNVVVLDDICTTGATFKEARRALLQAGAKKVLCVAIAH